MTNSIKPPFLLFLMLLALEMPVAKGQNDLHSKKVTLTTNGDTLRVFLQQMKQPESFNILPWIVGFVVICLLVLVVILNWHKLKRIVGFIRLKEYKLSIGGFEVAGTLDLATQRTGNGLENLYRARHPRFGKRISFRHWHSPRSAFLALSGLWHFETNP